MKYKDYVGVTEVDEEAGIIFGRVLGLRDVITFQGETVGEARRSFEESVDFYLKMCTDRGEAPEKPFSGKFVVRVEPELHRALARAAEESRQSMNAVVEQALRKQLGDPTRPASPEKGA